MIYLICYVTMWLKVRMIIRMESPSGMSPPQQIWRPKALWHWGFNVFNLSCNLTWPRFQSVMWLYGCKSVILVYHFAMLTVYWSSVSGDITHLICHMTSQNQVIERSYDFFIGSSSLYVTILQSLVVIGVVVVEISCF